MVIGCEMQKIKGLGVQIGNTVLRLLWHILHLIISICYWAKDIAEALESYVISSGIQDRYKSLNLDTLHNLAIAIDNEEAHCTSKVIKLLYWLEAIGVKNVQLYDSQGVLKKFKEAILEAFDITKPNEVTVKDVQLVEHCRINLEFLSSTDGKEAVAKAANHLFGKHYLDGNKKEPSFTESDISEALKSVDMKQLIIRKQHNVCMRIISVHDLGWLEPLSSGAGGPDPELLLVYGPVRCHLGFPVWRIRYTEIVHMGTLKAMRYGSLIKALQKFSMVRQNYGR